MVAVALWLAVTASAQVSEGWTEVVVLNQDALEHPTGLVKDWRYHPGDDPSWAEPS